jgi:hypothetical protein
MSFRGPFRRSSDGLENYRKAAPKQTRGPFHSGARSALSSDAGGQEPRRAASLGALRAAAPRGDNALRRAICDPEMSRPSDWASPTLPPSRHGPPFGKRRRPGQAGRQDRRDRRGAFGSSEISPSASARRAPPARCGNDPHGCPEKKPSTCRQYCRRPALLRRRIGISWRFFCGIVLLTCLLQNLNLTDRINFNPRLSLRFGPSFARKTPWFCKAATAYGRCSRGD